MFLKTFLKKLWRRCASCCLLLVLKATSNKKNCFALFDISSAQAFKLLTFVLYLHCTHLFCSKLSLLLSSQWIPSLLENIEETLPTLQQLHKTGRNTATLRGLSLQASNHLGSGTELLIRVVHIPIDKSSPLLQPSGILTLHCGLLVEYHIYQTPARRLLQEKIETLNRGRFFIPPRGNMPSTC